MAAEEKKAPPDGSAGDSLMAPLSSSVKKGDRQMFTVELQLGETTIVSWKKLLKDANKVNNGFTSALRDVNLNPALIAPGQTNISEQDAPQTNRFSAVIEKIERLYMGKDSSDEEGQLDVPDDQYDTEDSFIDDAELDDYFEVDNLAIQHDGFFVNRGKLECINSPPVLPNQPAKKRRQKDILKNPGENVDGHVSHKKVKVGKSAAGKTASLPVKSEDVDGHKLKNPGKNVDGHVSHKNVKVGKSAARKTASLPVKSEDVDGHILKNTGENVDGHVSHKNVKVSKSAAGKTASLPVKSGVDSSHNLAVTCEHYEDLKSQSQLVVSQEKSGKHAPKSKTLLKTAGSSSVRPKTTMLEKTIRELETMVAESRPPTMENQEVDTTAQAIKRRLPREIRLKLAKVARLASASQGKVSNELINRLMSILGHLIQLRTLKRNLKNMISMGLSAKQEKADRFQQIKKEVIEMIKTQAPSMESKQQHQSGASADPESGPDGKATTKRNFCMDATLEDKICDLYDLFVDGLDEYSPSQIRKLYVELAGLWPNGCMDNHGVRSAICRAKERRRALHSKHTDHENMKRKKLSTTQQEGNVLIDASSMAVQAVHPSMNGPKQEKAKGSSSCSQDDVRVADGVLIKKKVKRKTV